MKYADTHAHLTWKSFDRDRDEVIRRAREAGVHVIIDSGIDQDSNRHTLRISSGNEGIYSTLGFQPSQVPELDDERLSHELEFIEDNLDHAVALGEVGLDYHWVKDSSGRQRQEGFFKRCCDVAVKRDIPLVVHSRESESRCMDILEKSGLSDVVMHCFSGSVEELERAVNAGYHVSIPASVCYSKKHQKNSISIPDHLLLLETDCPFLPPRRGERNEPAFIVEGYGTVASLRNCDTEELGKTVLNNTMKIFRFNK